MRGRERERERERETDRDRDKETERERETERRRETEVDKPDMMMWKKMAVLCRESKHPCTACLWCRMGHIHQTKSNQVKKTA